MAAIVTYPRWHQWLRTQNPTDDYTIDKSTIFVDVLPRKFNNPLVFLIIDTWLVATGPHVTFSP